MFRMIIEKLLNYLVAEKLLNEAYERQMLGKYWNNLFRAGQNIQNLTESVEIISQRNELTKIRNVGDSIKGKIQSYLTKTLQKN